MHTPLYGDQEAYQWIWSILLPGAVESHHYCYNRIQKLFLDTPSRTTDFFV